MKLTKDNNLEEPGYSCGQATIVSRKLNWGVDWFEIHGHTGMCKMTIDGLKDLQMLLGVVIALHGDRPVNTYESDPKYFPELNKKK